MLKTLKKLAGKEEKKQESQYSAQNLLKRALKSGVMQKCGGSVKSWKKRFFVLVETYLFYFKDDTSADSQGFIRLDDADERLIERADKEIQREFSLKIVTPERTYYIAAESEYIIESWIHTLKLVCNKYADNISTAKIVGWLQRKGAKSDTVFKDRYCAIGKGNLYMYRNEGDTEAKKIYSLAGATVRRADDVYKKPCIQVNITDYLTGKALHTLVLVSQDDDVDIWKYVVETEAQSSSIELADKSKFKGWLFLDTTFGKLKKWDLKYFVLSDTKLVYFEDDKASEEEGSFELVGRLITRADEKALFTFKISSYDEDIYLQAQDDDETDCWVEVLKNVCKNNSIQDLAKSGNLTKQGGSIKTWKKRWCTLHGTTLSYFGDKNDSEPKGTVELAGMNIRQLTPREAEEEVGHNHVLKIFTPQRTWFMYADSSQDVFEWTVVMRKAALDLRGKVYVVDPTSTSKNKKEGRFASIQDAVNKAKDNDKIIIYPGIYTDSLTIKKALILEGQGNVSIECRTSTPVTFRTTVCRLTNIHVRQIATSTECNAINIEKGNILLNHCDISSGGGNCVNVNDESQLTMLNSKVSNGKQYGVWLSAKASALLENNEIVDNGWDGIMLMGDSDAIIRGCKIAHNRYNGISVSTAGRVIVENNELTGNTWDGVSVSNMKSTLRIHDNKILNNSGYGIYFSAQPRENLVICDNEVVANTKGQVANS